MTPLYTDGELEVETIPSTSRTKEGEHPRVNRETFFVITKILFLHSRNGRETGRKILALKFLITLSLV